jgi:hypothetical protein
MVRSMISLSPDDRLSCDRYLVDYRDTVFPDSFYTFFNRFISDINDLAAPTYPTMPATAVAPGAGVGPTPFGSEGVASALASSSDDRIERVWLYFESIIAVLPATTPEHSHKPEAVQSHVRACPPVPVSLSHNSLTRGVFRDYFPFSLAFLAMKSVFPMSLWLRLNPLVIPMPMLVLVCQSR